MYLSAVLIALAEDFYLGHLGLLVSFMVTFLETTSIWCFFLALFSHTTHIWKI